jgi:hypothetical protein
MPWFDAEERRALQRAAEDIASEAEARVQDEIDAINAVINDLTVSPVAFNFVATAGQTAFQVNGVATDQGELVLVFRNGLRLRPTFDYTTSFTLDPDVTTITLVTPALLSDVISGVIYNIAVDSIGAVDAQARTDIAAIAAAPIVAATNETIDDRVAALLVAGTNVTLTYNDVANTLTVAASGGGASNLDALTDVVISSPATGQILRYNGTNWVNVANSEIVTLTQLSDVTITSPSVGQVLKWNGSAWVNDVDATSGGGGTNLTFSRTTTTVTVESDTGVDAVLPAATTSLAGVLTSADKTKLDGIATAATANATDAALRDRSTHTGTQALSTLSQSGATNGQVPQWNGSTWTPATVSGGGSGTVTSVSFATTDSSLTVTGSPVTTSGTISVTLNTVPINKGGTGATTASAARTNLGLGTAATSNTGDFAAASHNHDASAINSGVLADARIPNLDAAKVTAGQFADARRGVFVQSGTPTGVTGGVWIW